jgi:hypothetical protein
MCRQKITYLYRDAGNYKFWGEFFVAGNLSESEISPFLIDGEYFVPEKIGIPSLVPAVRNDDDHLLHEFYCFEQAAEAICKITAEDFIARVREANRSGWF